MKKTGKLLWCFCLVLLLSVVAFVLCLIVTEYRPAPVEEIPVPAMAGNALLQEEEIRILSWNIGFAGLGQQEDFFMDGGSGTKPKSRETVLAYLSGIESHVKESKPDFLLLQELDLDSHRSYRIDQSERLATECAFTAYNYACIFVPYPLPPLGRIYSGLMTDCAGSGTAYVPDRVERVSLPCPFSWPISVANLKRCLLVSYIPVANSDRQLVLINLHLEAYDDGEGKAAQTRMLWELMEREYAKGNYVIAGGDFNQIFPETEMIYPNQHSEIWSPGMLEAELLPEGWRYAYDPETPSCRLLNQPYDPADTENTQYYVIDGFILSPNVQLQEVKTEDLGFACSDHNPVSLRVILKSRMSSRASVN